MPLEPSATPGLQLVLDFDVPNPREDRVEPDELELAISVTASLAAHAARAGCAFGLRGNGSCRGAPLLVAASAAPAQLTIVLEALARARSRPSGPLSIWLAQQSLRDFTQLGAVAVVTFQLSAELSAGLQRLRRRGVHVFVVLVGAQASADGLAVRHVAYEEGWAQREALVLA